MNDLERLVASEAIRQLKARYWQAIDGKDEALLRSVFTDDAAILLHGESTERRTPTRDPADPQAFVKRCIGTLGAFTTAHHGHNPLISFRSDTEADVTWPMEDNLWPKDPASTGFAHLHGFGLYHDTCRKTEDGWKICATTLQRVHVTQS